MKERIELIGEGSTTAVKEMKLIFGYIAIEISLDNANRAGELRNMNMNKFRIAEVKPDGSASTWIGNHKTANSYGHARLYINPNVYKALKVYQDKIRPLAKPSTKAFFVNCSGKMMASNAVRKSMQLFWRYCGLKGQVGPSLLRKVGATSVSRTNPEMVDQMSYKMNHLPSTNRKIYTFCNKKQNSERIGRGLHKCILNKRPEDSRAISLPLPAPLEDLDTPSPSEAPFLLPSEAHARSSSLAPAPPPSVAPAPLPSASPSLLPSTSPASLPPVTPASLPSVTPAPLPSASPPPPFVAPASPPSTSPASLPSVTPAPPPSVPLAPLPSSSLGLQPSVASSSFMGEAASTIPYENSEPNIYFDEDDDDWTTVTGSGSIANFEVGSVIKCSREEFSFEQLSFLYVTFYNLIEKGSRKIMTKQNIDNKLEKTNVGTF